MVMVNTPGYANRNRNAILSQAGALTYGQPNQIASRAPISGGPVGARRAATANPMGAYGASLAGGGAAPAYSAVSSQAKSGAIGGLGGAFQSQMDAANAANEARYNEALQRSDALHQRSMGNIDQMGKAERMAVDERLNNSTQDIQQSLLSKGLSASTAGIAPMMAAQRERTFAGHDLADRLAKLRLGTDIDITNQRLGMMERREDVGPDMNLLAQLAQGQGYAEGGGAAAIPAMLGGGFGQVGFNTGYSMPAQYPSLPRGPTSSQRMAALVNAGKAKYNSGYSKGGASASFAKPNMIAASQPFINSQLDRYSAYV